ncbi:type VI secretion system baseplate subunit TssG [Erwinia amylovora]|uniref:COG3520: putative type VI secretion system, core protein n=1 Tax=Erwinia amylovora ATCC BAA-2158 TaxID=889211 RepID=E5B8U9_ERWAM|nr:type VI secretion system baseplate subunit TssG [Erwinia amylovora]CBX81904.1 COG3520: putative type VI secretion system, core protein [Erwinia amylovora ATCC BAA-2158]
MTPQPAAQAEKIHRLHRLPPDFWAALCATPWRYDLFQLLRRLDAQGGQRYPLGRAPLPRHEPLRIGQRPSLAFAPAAIASVSPRENSALHDVSIYSFGLFGPNGPLPIHLTEYARERSDHHQDNSLSAFADLFHHRLTLLFYRAWADAQPTVALDRAEKRQFERWLASLIGMGQPGQLNQGSVSPHSRLALAGHLTRHARDAEGLQKMLSHYFQVPVKLVENVPHWQPVDRRDRASLGAGRRKPRLGISAFLGVAVRDVQHKFRLELGPLPMNRYQRFLPGEPWAQQLRDWVRQYLGIEFVWEVRLILDAADVQGVTLGGPSRLGYSSWLGQPAVPQPRSDLTFSPEPLAEIAP